MLGHRFVYGLTAYKGRVRVVALISLLKLFEGILKSLLLFC